MTGIHVDNLFSWNVLTIKLDHASANADEEEAHEEDAGEGDSDEWASEEDGPEEDESEDGQAVFVEYVHIQVCVLNHVTF